MTTRSLHALEKLLRERIVILDGAMGTMVQRYQLQEADYRGDRFQNHPAKDLKGALELLQLTRPEVIEKIHTEYLEAGADIIETNTFSATTIGQHDFLYAGKPHNNRKDPAFFQRVVEDAELRSLVVEMNAAAAQLARSAAERVAHSTGTPRFVAGAIGPLPVTASISPDVNDPAFRAVTFDQIRTSYSEQVRGLVDGGVDLLLVETIFDTLNAKAAFFAIDKFFDDRHISLPLMASVTFIQAGSNRGVTGQTIEAFWNSISHVPLLSVGINCALGPKEMRPLIEELSRLAPIFVSCHPNAGLPNPLLPTGFPETPDNLAPQLKEWAENGWLNLVGGCCGTTPAHIKALAEAVRGLPPRVTPSVEPHTRLSGLEAVTIRPESNFVNIGERTNVTGSPKFAKLILAGDYEGALAIAKQQVEGGAQIIDINMDEGLLDSQ